MPTAAQNQKNQDSNDQLRVDVAKIQVNIDYLKAGQVEILNRMDKFAFVPKVDFDELKIDYESFKKDVSNNYRKKEDGKTSRAFFISVGTAVTITVVTLVVVFVLKGAFGNGQ